ncbi:MAG: hypothetical protein KC478_08240 [Bacteriovoracaceae bacterium]|nr:hypothetical protein [Bacteriovoracaceae bacterium]
MEYIDNKSFENDDIVSKNNQLEAKNRELLERIEIRIRDLNIQPPQFTFHERELAYETFRINDSIDLIHQQMDELVNLTEAKKNIKLLTLYDSLISVERYLDDLESMPYA